MKSCLVVDDSRVVRKVSRRILEALGFEVAEAADASEALAWRGAVTPDLMIVEWRLPGVDGPEFLRRLCAQPGAAAARLVVCSADAEIAHIREALDAGADEYIMKPFDRSIVAGKLEGLGLAR